MVVFHCDSARLMVMQCIMARKRPKLCIVIINQMIKSFSGNKRSLPYGMALSDLLEKEVGGLEKSWKVYLNQAQSINANTALQIGFKA